MQHTQSATELMPVAIEPNGSGGADVWLNRDIAEVELTGEDGTAQRAWEADQAHGTVGRVPTAQEVEADFDAWWDALERASMTVPQLIAEVAEQGAQSAEMVEVLAGAVAELAELIGGE